MSELARLAYRLHIELSSNKARSLDRKKPGKHFFQGEKRKLVKRGHFEVLRKKSSNMPHAFGLGNPKIASDLKLDLIMTASQRGPNVQLMGNPDVHALRQDNK